MMRRIGIIGFSALVCVALLIAPAAVMAIEFQVPGTDTKLNVGGYVKLDVIYNDVSSGDPATGDDNQCNIEYCPGSVPLDGSGDEYSGEVILNGRESRLWVKTTTPTKLGPMKTHLEFDFDTTDGNQLVSNSRHGRIRHAYGTINNWLLGRTWSLWMHLNSLPETNDFGGATGVQFVRQAQLRYTMKLTDNSNLAIGIENPETFYTDPAPDAFPASDDGVIPDVIVRYSMNPSWGNLSFAGMLREFVIEEGAIDDDEFGYGAQVGAVVKLGANDKIQTQISYGTLGRYSSLAAYRDVVITAANQIEGLDQLAAMVAYEHKWGGPWNCRSNAIVGYTKADDPPELAGSSSTETTLSLHLNTFVDPAPGFRVGLEYIRGEREVYDGRDGTLNRVQFSTRFVF